MMDDSTYHLLFDVPKSADYAVDSTDLDPEDILESRVIGINALLNSSDMEVKFTAARILTSWGYEQGLAVLEEYIQNPESVENWLPNRLHGFNDSFKYMLMALNRFVAINSDNGQEIFAKTRAFPVISKILELSKEMPFNIDYFLSHISFDEYYEFIPQLESILKAIIDYPEIHGWKIYDVMQILLKFNPDFVNSLLVKKGKKLDDFNHREKKIIN